MRYFFITLLTILAASSAAQDRDTTFEFTDTTFTAGAVHHLPIAFHFSKSGMIEDSAAVASLEYLAEFAKTHPNLQLQLEHHTDTRGNALYNQKLSESRIKAVHMYMQVKFAIDVQQIIWKGVGEEKPIYPTAMIESMSSEGEQNAAHAANRRTLVRIVAIQ